MRRTITIQGKDYTKGGFEKKWSEIVSGTECNFFLKGEDERFVNDVIDLTSRWGKIKSKGLVRYKIRNKKFQGKAVRGIVIISPNSKREIWVGKGKIVDELFPRSAPVPEYKQNKKDALVALRQIIEPQIKTYRKSVLRQLRGPMAHRVRCAASGQIISAAEFHIDHKYPFKNLVEEWCRDLKIDLENVDVYCRGTKCYLKNTTLAESWFDYHQMNAVLQVLIAKENLKKGSKYYG